MYLMIELRYILSNPINGGKKTFFEIFVSNLLLKIPSFILSRIFRIFRSNFRSKHHYTNDLSNMYQRQWPFVTKKPRVNIICCQNILLYVDFKRRLTLFTILLNNFECQLFRYVRLNSGISNALIPPKASFQIWL